MEMVIRNDPGISRCIGAKMENEHSRKAVKPIQDGQDKYCSCCQIATRQGSHAYLCININGE